MNFILVEREAYLWVVFIQHLLFPHLYFVSSIPTWIWVLSLPLFAASVHFLSFSWASNFPLRFSYKALPFDRVPEVKSVALCSSWFNSTDIHWIDHCLIFLINILLGFFFVYTYTTQNWNNTVPILLLNKLFYFRITLDLKLRRWR